MAQKVDKEQLKTSKVMQATIKALRRHGCEVDEEILIDIASEDESARNRRLKKSLREARLRAQGKGLHVLSESDIKKRKLASKRLKSNEK